MHLLDAWLSQTLRELRAAAAAAGLPEVAYGEPTLADHGGLGVPSARPQASGPKCEGVSRAAVRQLALFQSRPVSRLW